LSDVESSVWSAAADRYQQRFNVLNLYPDGLLTRDAVCLQLAFGDVTVDGALRKR
jgi:hypothetical protein